MITSTTPASIYIGARQKPLQNGPSYFRRSPVPLVNNDVGFRKQSLNVDAVRLAYRIIQHDVGNWRRAEQAPNRALRRHRRTFNTGRITSPVRKNLVFGSDRHALLQNAELMPQYQDFGFQPPSGLEAVPQDADEEDVKCDHQSQSCPDSLAAVTPAVFGSDSYWRLDVTGVLH